MLSYRHAFHAGNHADVLKHVVLVEVLDYFLRKEKPWCYIDTHAGAGCYALGSKVTNEGEEFRTGIARLWACKDLPAPLAGYLAAVRQFNPSGQLVFYPGSPALARTRARAQDNLWLFELHPTDCRALRRTFAGEARVRVYGSDGFAGLRSLLPPPARRGVTLIDPPYEVKDDYRRVIDTLGDAMRRFPTGCHMVWYPLLERAESRRLPEKLARLGAGSWLDVRLTVRHPPRDGLGLYGSGLHLLNPPWVLPERLKAVLPWLAATLGSDDGAGFELDYRIE
jgi:23S rRNA (adenine2030-N6)-methyltransferase